MGLFKKTPLACGPVEPLPSSYPQPPLLYLVGCLNLIVIVPWHCCAQVNLVLRFGGVIVT